MATNRGSKMNAWVKREEAARDQDAALADYDAFNGVCIKGHFLNSLGECRENCQLLAILHDAALAEDAARDGYVAPLPATRCRICSAPLTVTDGAFLCYGCAARPFNRRGAAAGSVLALLVAAGAFVAVLALVVVPVFAMVAASLAGR